MFGTRIKRVEALENMEEEDIKFPSILCVIEQAYQNPGYQRTMQTRTLGTQRESKPHVVNCSCIGEVMGSFFIGICGLH